ncbi:MFS transporter [Mycolicibacterium fortuitum]|uniref:MFS transporter n=1 Tax=Mycolicibacterium fortuitum TaxID=1766 RepID=UPI0022A72D17|nr:MFS transporter [Mycolicibacterium fortuitum]
MTQTAIPATSTTIPRYQRWRFQIFAVTWIAYAGFYFTRQAFSVAKLGILEDPILSTHLTKSTLANLDAAYLAAYAVGQFVWGQVSDRFGPRVVILGGLAISAIATVFMGLLPALVFLLPLMIVQGLAQSTGWSPTLSNMAQFFSIGERGRVLGLWSTNYAFGGLVAAPILGWAAYDVFGSWRAAFFTGAAIVVGCSCSYCSSSATGRRMSGCRPSRSTGRHRMPAKASNSMSHPRPRRLPSRSRPGGNH